MSLVNLGMFHRHSTQFDLSCSARFHRPSLTELGIFLSSVTGSDARYDRSGESHGEEMGEPHRTQEHVAWHLQPLTSRSKRERERGHIGGFTLEDDPMEPENP